MQLAKNRNAEPVCLKTGKPIRTKRVPRLLRWLLPLSGLFALLWFIIRVIPKPSRATYPCQRVAMPVASGFVAWLAGLMTCAAAIHRARRCFAGSRYAVGIICILLSAAAIWLTASTTGEKTARAAQPHPVNSPYGVARGVNPGRVVWVHDVNATDWEHNIPRSDGYWWDNGNIDQKVVDRMVFDGIRNLAGELNVADAWDAIFRDFNKTHGKGDVGYTEGEKVVIKVNLAGCFQLSYHAAEDMNDTHSYDILGNDNPSAGGDYVNTSPQIMRSVLKQLVDVVDVNQKDITIGDPLSYFPENYYTTLHNQFPDVNFLEYTGKLGKRVASAPDANVPIHWSTVEANGREPDYALRAYVDASYLINIAVLKGQYASGGVSLCGKNHYGSLGRRADGTYDSDGNGVPDANYYNLHRSVCYTTDWIIDYTEVPGLGRPGEGHYRAVVDLMGHPDIGGKTLLCMIDGLYGMPLEKDNPDWNPSDPNSWPWVTWPVKWTMKPFDANWPSSIFISQDPVAIDSVGFDFLYAEWPDVPGPAWFGTDDYLHEAAQAYDPPSGTFYDPDGDGVSLASLGVHEHWNDPNDKQYSRNLDPVNGEGIELLALPSTLDGDYDHDYDVDMHDYAILAANWGVLGYDALEKLGNNWLKFMNQAPQPDAGDDQVIVWDVNVAQLDGAVSDDGYPAHTIVTLWRKVSGPGNVYFAHADALSTTAGFSLPGPYVLALDADDTALSATDEVTITVQYPEDNVVVFQNGAFKNSWRNLGDFRIAQAPDDTIAIFAEGLGWATIASIGSTNIGDNRYLEFDVYCDPNQTYTGTNIAGFHLAVNGDNGWNYLWDTDSTCWVDGIETTVEDATFLPRRWQRFRLQLGDNTAGPAFPSNPDIGVIRLHLADPTGLKLFLDNVGFTSY